MKVFIQFTSKSICNTRTNVEQIKIFIFKNKIEQVSFKLPFVSWVRGGITSQ
jgi:hypothetical protein